eukprot:1429614-Heterocapsa_arctica.AAC.1
MLTNLSYTVEFRSSWLAVVEVRVEVEVGVEVVEALLVEVAAAAAAPADLRASGWRGTPWHLL